MSNIKSCTVFGRTLPEAYHNALIHLEDFGCYNDCADWNCKQKEIALRMEVKQPLKEGMISKLCIYDPYQLEKYTQELLYGILDFEVDKGLWKYTYHDRMVRPYNQIQFVIDELKRNPMSRRAVISIRDNSVDMYSDDPACLQTIQYMIRDDKLHCFLVFRSNDALNATFGNSFALIMLQKRIADKLGVEMGMYVHTANSFHCYEKDFGVLTHHYERIIEEDLCNLTFNYRGYYDEMMKEERAKIDEFVKIQMEKEVL